MVQKLGEGAYGCVHLVKHKLDSVLYALKKIKIHMEFNDNDSREDRKMALLNHPAMKEIQAISKLSHKNIVGYKGCWVESEDADLDRIHLIKDKQHRRIRRTQNYEITDKIYERDDDDSDYEQEFMTS